MKPAASGHKRKFVTALRQSFSREFANEHRSIVGTLDKCIDEANNGGESLIDIKEDWETAFPHE